MAADRELPPFESRFVRPPQTIDRLPDGKGKTPILERPVILDVLADRYASIEALLIFEPNQVIIDERDLWITVLVGQKKLGADIPQNVINAYVAARDDVDHVAIRNRERILRHDEKAKLEAFNNAARKFFIPDSDTPEWVEKASLGMTSRDTSDPVEQARFRRGLMLQRDRAVATFARYQRLALEYSTLVYGGRTHMAIAQPNLVGKIFSDATDEMLVSFNDLETFIEDYPFRGLKGAMGTQTDQISLLGSKRKVTQLERSVATAFGFKNIFTSTGQEYPRSLDCMSVEKLHALICGPNSMALTLRNMASRDQFTEGFKEGQVGSVAMPYKMNSRSLERMFSLFALMKGYLATAAAISGSQIYGGDVSGSAARRIIIPSSIFATDATFQTLLTVLDECGFYPAVLNREVERYFPFLTATRILVAAAKKGVGREVVHGVIREHAVAVALDMREKGVLENDLFDRLARDTRLGLTRKEIDTAVEVEPEKLVGSAPDQIKSMIRKIDKIVKKYPEAAKYIPEEIL